MSKASMNSAMASVRQLSDRPSSVNVSKAAKDLLRKIRHKGNVKRDDLEKILNLDKESQRWIICNISSRRREVLIKCLDNYPNMSTSKRIAKGIEHLTPDADFDDVGSHSHKTSFCFQLSRRESYQSYYSQLEKECIGESINN